MFGLRAQFGMRRWRTRRALRTARMLDLVVDRQLPLLAALSEDGRRRSADYLAELVMLAQAYRYYAADWITRAELERRGRATVRRLEMLRQHRPSAAQFPEYD